jgi:hypothetical protein
MLADFFSLSFCDVYFTFSFSENSGVNWTITFTSQLVVNYFGALCIRENGGTIYFISFFYSQQVCDDLSVKKKCGQLGK